MDQDRVILPIERILKMPQATELLHLAGSQLLLQTEKVVFSGTHYAMVTPQDCHLGTCTW